MWHLCEHIRIAQEDIVEYVIGTNYKEIKWPDDYWPPVKQKATPAMWKKTIEQYKKDLAKWKRYIKTNYNENVLKKTIMIIDHTSYHTGELSLTVSALTKKKV